MYMKFGGIEGIQLQGKLVILFIIVGVKIGKFCKILLMCVEYDGQYVIVVLLGGVLKNLVWYYNVVKNLWVELQDGIVIGDYDVCEVFGDEKVIWWQCVVVVWLDYVSYQIKMDCQILVFVLILVCVGGQLLGQGGVVLLIGVC